VSTLVLTSLNPYANVGYQLRCLNEWVMLGYEIRSHNSDVESDILIDHGLQTEHLNRISIGETAEHFFGKPIPRILPTLERALQSEHNHFILTNSDIFPAHRKVISESLAKSFQTVAFTRTECLDPSLCRFPSQSFYQGGLDLFWFTKQGLHELLEILRQFPVAERMTFGIPGWDFFMGHFLCTKMNSPLVNGSIFIHKSHKITYGNIEEFEHYAPDMINSGQYASRQPIPLALEFATFIREDSQKNEHIARLLKLAFYKQASALPALNSENCNANDSVLKKFHVRLQGSQVEEVFTEPELEVFTGMQIDGAGWAITISLIGNHNFRKSHLLYRLQLLLLSLLCTQQQGSKTLTLKYPHGSMHMPALNQIVQNEYGPNRETCIFDLFASELIDHGIVNLNLMKYLFTAATNADEKALFIIVISICKQGLQHA